MIKSISYDQAEIIINILELHVVNTTIDCDPTFSYGNFYFVATVSENTEQQIKEYLENQKQK